MLVLFVPFPFLSPDYKINDRIKIDKNRFSSEDVNVTSVWYQEVFMAYQIVLLCFWIDFTINRLS